MHWTHTKQVTNHLERHTTHVARKRKASAVCFWRKQFAISSSNSEIHRKTVRFPRTHCMVSVCANPAAVFFIVVCLSTHFRCDTTALIFHLLESAHLLAPAAFLWRHLDFNPPSWNLLQSIQLWAVCFWMNGLFILEPPKWNLVENR